ncbi:MAG: helix-turn-helix transcriptional regulator [Bacteroidales bacterium]|nr:helix-turn-helix transcriptional regulator [Bacteroidales bacterium]
MKNAHVIIAEPSQLTRSGIMAILKQTGFSFVFREVFQAEKLIRHLQNEPKNLLIISNFFLNSCSPEVTGKIFSKSAQIRRVLIQDTGMNSRFYNDFHEILEPDDNEKVILRKLEKQVRELVKPDPACDQPEVISEREKDVLKLVAIGMTNKEIAEKLYISSHTVITHRKNITSKLGIKTIAGLTVYAIIHKLISF